MQLYAYIAEESRRDREHQTEQITAQDDHRSANAAKTKRMENKTGNALRIFTFYTKSRSRTIFEVTDPCGNVQFISG